MRESPAASTSHGLSRPADTPHGYRPALDGVRAAAVLSVLAYHLGVTWLPGGFLGVDIFFVLSGYLITSLLLAEHTPPEKRDEAIFEIVNQLNRGSHLIASVEERERVADLNLLAGRRAKASTAYDAALKYLRAGSALLTDETWERNYELMFSLEYLMAECEVLTAETVAAETWACSATS